MTQIQILTNNLINEIQKYDRTATLQAFDLIYENSNLFGLLKIKKL
jgi:hypothetical protein